MRKTIALLLLLAVAGTLSAQNKPAVTDKKHDPVLMTNQLMLVFLERMKNGDFNEAREIAGEMLFGHDKMQDTEKVEYRSFHSAMENELYRLKASRDGSKKEVIWIEQPVSDGFYLISMLDFQQGKHDEALANMQKAINWNPVRSAFHVERGVMLLKHKNGPDPLMAQLSFKKALELADNGEDFAAALRGLAFVAVERGRMAEGLACLLVSKTFDPTNLDAEEEMLFIRRADPDLFLTMDTKEAFEFLRKIGIQTTYSPDHIQVLMKLADNFTMKKAADKAIVLLKKADEMSPDNPEIKGRLRQFEKGAKPATEVKPAAKGKKGGKKSK